MLPIPSKIYKKKCFFFSPLLCSFSQPIQVLHFSWQNKKKCINRMAYKLMIYFSLWICNNCICKLVLTDECSTTAAKNNNKCYNAMNKLTDAHTHTHRHQTDSSWVNSRIWEKEKIKKGTLHIGRCRLFFTFRLRAAWASIWTQIEWMCFSFVCVYLSVRERD